MNRLFSEYGRFIVAIIGSVFVFAFYINMQNDLKDYSEGYIRTITGITCSAYDCDCTCDNSISHKDPDCKCTGRCCIIEEAGEVDP